MNDIRMIAIDLLDEIIAEAETCSPEYEDAQAEALEACGVQVGDCGKDSRDPKLVARALIIAIADRLTDAADVAPVG